MQKIDSLCTNKSISQPTHFTEHSSSLIDIILVSKKKNFTLSGVADPFLNRDLSSIVPFIEFLNSPSLSSRHLSGKSAVSDSVVADLLFIVTPIVRFCNYSMFCCTLLYVTSSF